MQSKISAPDSLQACALHRVRPGGLARVGPPMRISRYLSRPGWFPPPSAIANAVTCGRTPRAPSGAASRPRCSCRWISLTVLPNAHRSTNGLRCRGDTIAHAISAMRRDGSPAARRALDVVHHRDVAGRRRICGPLGGAAGVFGFALHDIEAVGRPANGAGSGFAAVARAASDADRPPSRVRPGMAPAEPIPAAVAYAAHVATPRRRLKCQRLRRWRLTRGGQKKTPAPGRGVWKCGYRTVYLITLI